MAMLTKDDNSIRIKQTSNFFFRNIRKFYFLLSFLFLIMGIFIYLLFRDLSNMIFFNFFPKFSNIILTQPNKSIFLYILKFNVPDMFWFLSGIIFFRFIWFNNYKEQTIYILCFYLLGISVEFCQLIKTIPGTFDFIDLLFMCIGAFVESLLYNNFIRRRLVV